VSKDRQELVLSVFFELRAGSDNGYEWLSDKIPKIGAIEKGTQISCLESVPICTEIFMVE
jgi:hypothetical protein